MNFKENITLENEIAFLRPLEESDFNLLCSFAANEDIWRFTPSAVKNDDGLKYYIHNALVARAKEQRYPFLITDKRNGKAAGSTCFGNDSELDKRIEIGWTWLGKEFQSTGLNRNVKLLMLTYAFEVLQYERVEFKTDVLNSQSRKALKKIGAVEEGILRSHTLMHDGRRRDTIYYSILKNEWPLVKKSLSYK